MVKLNNKKKIIPLCSLFFCVILIIFASCNKPEIIWEPGVPFPKEKIKIGVIHVSNPFTESAGYDFAHKQGIEKMKQSLGLKDNQVIYRTNVDRYTDLNIENAIKGLIVEGVNIIFATSFGYMEDCAKMAEENPNVVFAHASGYMYNDRNFTNYFGKLYEARYLSGIVAGAQTKTNKIGFVGAWGLESNEVTEGINAFAMGVEKVNPNAQIYISITNNWFDPIGETFAANLLIDEGCDIIAQHVDSPSPQIEAQTAGVKGIGYNTDMRADAPNAVITSVIWNWDVYYTMLVQSVIDGTFTTNPWYGSIKDGIVDLTPLSDIVQWKPETLQIITEERRRIESGELIIFNEKIEGYYRNIEVLK